jgi:putative drug exporter of the RND superfamily
VLIDASVIRMVLVPAVMALLGASAWWAPRWLQRVLPEIDIEGTMPASVVVPSPRTSADTDATTAARE